jgi:hypothetical protein
MVATVFFWKLVPETRGKTLEEIELCWIAGADGQVQPAYVRDRESNI